ncbi:DUF4105 domain-containing protein [Psychromonas aquatilis]|uniref:DUF4105 domain-containing protein n=1 Tax=Psychromonas aquatilis TaxID=2005072 RepID=A0ABU9GTM7_9GAMM
MNKLIIFILCLVSHSLFANSSFPLKSIAKENYWLQLGHYHSNFFGGWESEVDEDSFFIASDGKTNPAAELQATLDAFNGKNLTEQQKQTFICQFPARFTWLKSKVDNHWGELNCPELQEWKTVIDPEGITLVFPTAFMNNPSSMFGHTLLRIDAKDQTRNKELVAFAVNFAADPDPEDNAAMYAFNGLVGSYPGRYSLMPYYRKVREYNDLESRDIWEYKLNLDDKEVEKVLLHLWELQSVYFDYFFIDENCSYQLLSLLQLARENLDLTASFNMHAIPADTVAVLRENGLLQDPNYRPAFGTKLFHYSEQLSDQDLAIARKFTIGETPDISERSESDQAAILEIAYEWLNYDFYNKGLDRKVVAPRSTKLLIARSKLKVSSPYTQPEKPAISPELGHASSRLGLSTTFSNEYDYNTSLSYRLAYHDLLDKSAGYIPGAQISFFDVEASIKDSGHTRLEQLYLIDAIAIPADNRIFDSWSWNIQVGFDRQPDLIKQSNRFFTQGGYGKTIGNPNTLQAYALGSIEVNGGDITDNRIVFGLGSKLGAIWQVNPDHKAMLTGNIIYLADTDVNYHYNADLDWNWSLSRNWALRGKLRYQQWHVEDAVAKLSLFHYF